MLRRDLVNSLRRKPLEQIILHQNNAPAHRANAKLLDINLLGSELLEHSPYSPDLAPMDFCAFPEIKAKLQGRRFDSTSDLTKAARTVVSTFSEDWYAEIYRKWILRQQKCVDLNGDYVEKVCRSLDGRDF